MRRVLTVQIAKAYPFFSLPPTVTAWTSAPACPTRKRATATDMTNEINPAWSAAQEIGRNLRLLSFAYFDRHNNQVSPNSLANRRSISRVDVRMVAETAGNLSNGGASSYPLSFRT